MMKQQKRALQWMLVAYWDSVHSYPHGSVGSYYYNYYGGFTQNVCTKVLITPNAIIHTYLDPNQSISYVAKMLSRFCGNDGEPGKRIGILRSSNLTHATELMFYRRDLYMHVAVVPVHKS